MGCITWDLREERERERKRGLVEEKERGGFGGILVQRETLRRAIAREQAPLLGLMWKLMDNEINLIGI